MKKNSFFTILIVIGIVLVLSIFSIRFCPFFYFFNIPCPGCGLTRAFICLLHGNIIQSLHYNIFGVIFSKSTFASSKILPLKESSLFCSSILKCWTIFEFTKPSVIGFEQSVKNLAVL